MRVLLAIVGISILLLIAAFCAFGFLATFEPTTNALAFRIGYTVMGIGCLVGMSILIVNAIRE